MIVLRKKELKIINLTICALMLLGDEPLLYCFAPQDPIFCTLAAVNTKCTQNGLKTAGFAVISIVCENSEGFRYVVFHKTA